MAFARRSRLLLALLAACLLAAGCGGEEPAATPGDTEEAEPAPGLGEPEEAGEGAEPEDERE